MILGAASQHDWPESPERFPQPDTFGTPTDVPKIVRAPHDRSIAQQPVRDTQRDLSDSLQPSVLESVA